MRVLMNEDRLAELIARLERHQDERWAFIPLMDIVRRKTTEERMDVAEEWVYRWATLFSAVGSFVHDLLDEYSPKPMKDEQG